MIAVGDPVPDVRVWTTAREPVALREVAADGACLLLFYLFDWSST